MHAETTAPHAGRRARLLRADVPEPTELAVRLAGRLPLLLVAAAFVLTGVSREPGEADGRLGLSIGAGIGPMGQVFGGWDPAIALLPVAAGKLWAFLAPETSALGAIRWPEAFAALGLAWIVAARVRRALGGLASTLAALTLCGTIAGMDRSAALGLDLLLGLTVVAALDRILAEEADPLGAGAWAALAFLAGGWPALAAIGLATVPSARHVALGSARFLVPVGLTVVGWSAWACAVASVPAWASAMTLPLPKGSDWWFAPGVLALGLPWTPFAGLVAFPAIRAGWDAPGRRLVLRWGQVAAACLVVGTVVPGLAAACRVPALAGLAILAAAGWDRAWAENRALAPWARRTLLGACLALGLGWCAIAFGGGTYVALAVSYYRPVAIAVASVGVAAGASALIAARRGAPRAGLVAVAAVAVGLKLTHAGFFVPETNYRFGQGPWGRAIGQWVPRDFPIYTTHTWAADLAFSTGKQVRQLSHARLLEFQPGPDPKFVLLHPAEFEHWPADAPTLQLVRRFEDEFGGARVLARTAGPFSWRQAAIDARDAQ